MLSFFDLRYTPIEELNEFVNGKKGVTVEMMGNMLIVSYLDGGLDFLSEDKQ